MIFDVLTIFPQALELYFEQGVLGKARERKLLKVNFHDLRDFTTDKHKSVDDKPFGGGPGMVMRVEPVYKAVNYLRKQAKLKSQKTRVILLAAGSKVFTQKKAIELTKYDRIIFVCGRYEGVDQRVEDHVCDEAISIGRYILSGGELAAAVIIDSTARLAQGVLGNEQSLLEESYEKGIVSEYPQYTRPEVFQDWRVPKVLLSGNHQKIKKWRQDKSKQ
ncbi:MAG: tRNA (guanosine(37)-N1)-methyltransferase TrmD [Candidatus Moranbacteria bacterium]|nr:tRNA (guanosine(37)-N1)-methyltransferase TrmD [Candidatus Moranbacteria bacterium]